MFHRALNLDQYLKTRSLLLLGPRQTGKTTLLELLFKDTPVVNLLESETYRDLASRPELFRQRINPESKLILVDEIQRVPHLLNEIHLLLQKNRELRFVLTGSSARKLREGSTNLLAGRAWPIRFHPLVTKELGSSNKREILRLMNVGGLPAVYESRDPEKDLRAYIGTYLQEEIRAEGLVRSVDRFSRFIDVAAFANGELINFTKIGSDTGIPPRTIIEYFKILEDTMLGTLVEPFKSKNGRKTVASSKFYLFDRGVANSLLKRGLVEQDSESFGRALEHAVFLELRAYLDYALSDQPLCFWRTQSGFEVDFVVGGRVAIEVKASHRVNSRDEKGLQAFSQDVPKLRRILVCTEAKYRKTDSGIEIFPFLEFFQKLWAGEIIKLDD